MFEQKLLEYKNEVVKLEKQINWLESKAYKRELTLNSTFYYYERPPFMNVDQDLCEFVAEIIEETKEKTEILKLRLESMGDLIVKLKADIKLLRVVM